MFDAALWNDELSTSTFYTFIASLRRKIRDEVRQPTTTHRFIRTLRDSQRLVRCYTQNIDGLEAREGLSMDLNRGKGNKARFTKRAMVKLRPLQPTLPGSISDGGCEVVPLHGDLNLLRCTLCQQKSKWDENGNEAMLLRGCAPACQSCALQDQERRVRGKRGTKIGSLRPNIVLYGEEHPSADMLSQITTHDLGIAPDILLILGTSLQVHGLKVLVREFARSVHSRPGGKGKVIFVNHTKPSESAWKDTLDYWVSMDCDEWVADLRRRKPILWQKQAAFKFQVTKLNDTSFQKSMSTCYIEQKDIDDKENQVEIDTASLYGKPLQQKPRKAVNAPLLEQPELIHPNVSRVSTPRKVSHHNVGLPEQLQAKQLPTPPSSRHKSVLNDVSRKRSHVADDDIEQPCVETPSKRNRTAIRIYDDRPIQLDCIANTESNRSGPVTSVQKHVRNVSKQITRLDALQIRIPLGARVDQGKLADLIRRKKGSESGAKD